jgi:predicted permease
MLHVLSQVFVLFALLLTGFVARRLGVFEASHIKGMTSLIIKVSLPAMVLHSMASMPFSLSVLGDSALILLYSIVIHACLIVLALPLGRMLKGKPGDAGVYRFVLVFSNVGFMGFPVIESIFGKSALFYTAIYNLPFNLLVFTVGIALLVHHRPEARFKLSASHVFSPVIISVILGFILFISGLKLPGPLNAALDLTGSLTTPLSMMAIGGMLAGTSFRRTFTQWRLYVVSGLRLLVWPLLVFAILRSISPDFLLAAIPAVISGMPAAANTAILAHEYNANEALASQAVFVTTLLSVISIPLLAAIFEMWRF